MTRLFLARSLLIACVLLGTSVETQDRFRTSTDAVLVDVQVLSGGKPVAGLTAADFELRDSGVRQQIQAVSFADVPISLLLALDVSSSVQGERLQQLKAAARSAVAALREGDEAAVLAFDDRVSFPLAWTSDHAVANATIDKLNARGWTALYDAVFASVTLRQRAKGRIVVLVFSDGEDTSSWLDGPTAIGAARHSDVVVTVVSAAARPKARSGREARQRFGFDEAFLRSFSSEPVLFPYAFLEVLTAETGGQPLYVGSDRELAGAFRKIVEDFKTRYLLTYSPLGVPSEGWHPIDVKLTSRRADVTARRGYWRSAR